MTGLRSQAAGILALVLALTIWLIVLYVNAPTCDELVDDARTGELAWNRLPDRCWE